MDMTQEEIDKLFDLWPARCTAPLLAGETGFGLLMSNDVTIYVTRIVDIFKDAAGSIWLDVDIFPGKGIQVDAPTNATVSARHIVAVFPMAAHLCCRRAA